MKRIFKIMCLAGLASLLLPLLINTPIAMAGNNYDECQCTWWAQEKRQDLPGFSGGSGHAKNWASSARAAGFETGTTPIAGAIVVFQPKKQGADPDKGHVAYVEQVYSGTSFRISEMGWVSNPCNEHPRDAYTENGVEFIYYYRDNWKGEYYNNRTLTNYPAFVRVDSRIDYDWGSGGPGNGVGNDNFSVRWTRNWNFAAGRYRFHLRGDDGIRLWVDGNLIINQWHDQGRTEYTAERDLSGGSHSLKVEYYENGGDANVALWWESSGNTCPTITDWKGEYWNNKSLSGSPVLCRNDHSVDFDWGSGGPGGGVPNDNFSVRWTRNWNFTAGRYRFHLRGDDGIRLWVDGNLIINQWRDQGRTEYTAERDLSGGSHSLKVEYYEHGGDANVALWWDGPLSSTCPTITDWKGEYWNNKSLSGSPVLCRNDHSVDFDWGSGGPGGGVPNDNFSVRWTRNWNFTAGRYRFHLRGDDGIRLWVDGNLIINQWRDQGRTEYTAERDLSGGSHSLKVEYYEHGGDANVALWWEQGGSNVRVRYQAHVAGLGWLNWVGDSEVAGTTGQFRQMEAVRIRLENAPAGVRVKYRTHVTDLGWLNWVHDGGVAGTTGQSRRMEAVQIQLEGNPANLHICYQAHVANYGWLNWVCDGAIAGTTGQSRQMEALRVRVETR